MTAPAPIDAPRPMCVSSARLMLLAARILVVRERRVRPDEDVVGDAQAVPELDAALDRDAIADDDVVLDEDVIADVAVGADGRARQHVREGPDARARADAAALAQRLRVNVDAMRPQHLLGHGRDPNAFRRARQIVNRCEIADWPSPAARGIAAAWLQRESTECHWRPTPPASSTPEATRRRRDVRNRGRMQRSR